MKKILILFTLLALALVLTGCGCKHEHTEIQNAAEATCLDAGYTGDTYCLDCKKVIKKGETIEALGHVEGSLKNAYEASCRNEGYTGDICCMRCGELLVQGETIAKLPHTPSEKMYAAEATCSSSGYTGDVWCTECGEMLEYGETIEPLPHTFGERENAREASCTVEGYTGDATCSVCGFVDKGETAPRLEHSYGADGACSVCGWIKPGLYIEGELGLTWDELVNGGYVTMDGGELRDIAEGLTGRLVISEDVTSIRRTAMYQRNVNEVWFPCTVTVINDNILHNSAIEEVRFFGAVTKIDDYAFQNCLSLKAIELPDTLTELGFGVFMGCTSLESIVIPEGVKELKGGAFSGCLALSSVTLPEGLTTIGYQCFTSSLMTGFTPPSTLEYIDSGVFQYSGNLKTIDLSGTAVTSLEATISECPALEEVKLPAGLVSARNMFYGCPLLKAVVIPDGVTRFDFNGSDSAVETIVWPESLLDAEGIKWISATLTTIHYRGSELKWSLVSNKPEWIDDVEVDFDYAE